MGPLPSWKSTVACAFGAAAPATPEIDAKAEVTDVPTSPLTDARGVSVNVLDVIVVSVSSSSSDRVGGLPSVVAVIYRR